MDAVGQARNHLYLIAVIQRKGGAPFKGERQCRRAGQGGKMGAISRFDIARLASEFGINAYIETGVGLGASLSHAATVIADVCGCEGNREVHQRFLARASSDSLRQAVAAVLEEPLTAKPVLSLSCARSRRIASPCQPISLWG
jgi:hypothetical protein